jgi:hypothetical protein
MQAISEFEARNRNPEAGALLSVAVWAVDSLYYLGDLDQSLDPSQAMVGGHSADVVDVAHARWAVMSCITALDLCAAGLGRALCRHKNKRELALGDFDVSRDLDTRYWRRVFSCVFFGFCCFIVSRKHNRSARLRASLPERARQWVDNVLSDPEYRQIKAARNALTHARVPRHLTLPRQRIRLQVKKDQIDVPTIIDTAKRVARKHVSELLAILPKL